MLGNEAQWLIGVIITGIAVMGGIIMRDRHVLSSISKGDERLHTRINQFEKGFVRRADLNGHIQSLETMVNQMRDEQRETNRRIDRLLQIMTKKDI